MIDEASLEALAEELPVKDQAVRGILKLAAGYLAQKMASSWRPESEADLRMRRAGVSCQQQLVQYVLRSYNQSSPAQERESRLAIKNGLASFWEGYHQLVLAPLRERGYNLAELPVGTGLRMVETLEHGVKGMVAVCMMARVGGWEIIFPSIEEDVKMGRDLIIQKGNLALPIQIKCLQDTRFTVARGGTPSGLTVHIPANPEFFRDPEVGIPHNKHAGQFNSWVTNQLGGGK